MTIPSLPEGCRGSLPDPEIDSEQVSVRSDSWEAVLFVDGTGWVRVYTTPFDGAAPPANATIGCGEGMPADFLRGAYEILHDSIALLCDEGVEPPTVEDVHAALTWCEAALRAGAKPKESPVANPEPTSGVLVLEHPVGPYVARFYEPDDERERVFQLWRDGVQVLDSEWTRGCAETSSGDADVVNILDDGNLTAREVDELLAELVKATGADTFSPRCW